MAAVVAPDTRVGEPVTVLPVELVLGQTGTAAVAVLAESEMGVPDALMLDDPADDQTQRVVLVLAAAQPDSRAAGVGRSG